MVLLPWERSGRRVDPPDLGVGQQCTCDVFSSLQEAHALLAAKVSSLVGGLLFVWLPSPRGKWH